MARIAHDQSRRAIPWFGVQGVVLVERFEILVEVFVGAPRRRHEDARRREQVDAAFDKQLEHVVEALRIRTRATDVIADVGNIEQRRVEFRLTCERPVAVGADRVDLAIVGEHAKRLCKLPVWRGIGRETLVEGHCRAHQFGALQIRKDIAQTARCGHCLVTNCRDGEADHIENFIINQGEFAAPTCTEQGTVKHGFVHAIGRVDEDLADAGAAAASEWAAGLVAGRYIAPARWLHAFLAQTSLQLLRCSVGLSAIVIEENQSSGKAWVHFDQ